MSDFDKDSDCIAYALRMWANYIETGDPVSSSSDVIGRIKSLKDSAWNIREKSDLTDSLKELSEEQKAFVVRLRALAGRTKK